MRRLFVICCIAFTSLLSIASEIGFENGIPSGWTTIGNVNTGSDLNAYQGNSFVWVSNAGLAYSALLSPTFVFDHPTLISFAFSYMSRDGGGYFDPAYAVLMPTGFSPPDPNQYYFYLDPYLPAGSTVLTMAGVECNNAYISGAAVQTSVVPFTQLITISGSMLQDGNCPGFWNPSNGAIIGIQKGATDWITASYIAAPGTYQLGFFSTNTVDHNILSALAVDDVHIDPVPEPSGFWLLLSAGIAFLLMPHKSGILRGKLASVSVKCSFSVVLLVCSCALAPSLRADDFVDAHQKAYIPGTNLAGCGFFCTETFDATFRWNVTTNTLVPGSMVVNATGDLGQFSFDHIVLGNPNPLFAYDNALGDQMFFLPLYQGLAPVFPTPYNYPTQLFMSCGTVGDICDIGGFAGRYLLKGELDVVPAPETWTAAHSALGMLLVLAVFSRTERTSHASLKCHQISVSAGNPA